MLPIDDARIRASFINATQRERAAVTLPAGFATLDWDALDFLGWRDPKLPKVGYVVVEAEGGLVGVMLREADGRIRTRPQCSWCADVTLPNDVVFYTAKRSGASGRNGNTVGTLACAGFECSRNARRLPSVAYVGFDVEAARQRRIEALREHVAGFVHTVREGS
ncbi:FBP C-terminal treble-clef zinc-finger [Agromyces sp. CF514]|uniref:FBP domain-containing protein n=1 Tax=Agromyces sp. CF514 TaxID=1881031 RepID=UPI0008E19968|nr:FBP domain-containing protein [Agromyces sp. CF514]SFR69521.1 FBP C-terminal treble-clef zinc-finger [Agromyces sp. CF514]